MNHDRIIVAGGSGFLGSLLAPQAVARGYQVIILTRRNENGPRTVPVRSGLDSERTSEFGTHTFAHSDALRTGTVRGPLSSGALLPGRPVTHVQWDGRTLGPWAAQLNGARAVINLAGRSVNCRFTQENRREIIESRVNSVNLLGEAMRRCAQPPRVFIQAAGQAIYGDYGEGVCDEGAPPGEGFLVKTCLVWEKAFNELPTSGTRRVLLRIGFVLSATGGALKPLAKITRWGLGGRVGTGRQWISWIHHADMTNILLSAIEREEWQGVFNASAPNPVRNAEFMLELRHALHRPWSPPVPVWAVHLGAWLMRTEPRLALTGRAGVPKRLLEHQFAFRFQQLGEALEDVFRKKS